MFLLPYAFQPQVLAVEGETTRILNMRWIKRDNDLIAGAGDRAGPGIFESVFKLKDEIGVFMLSLSGRLLVRATAKVVTGGIRIVGVTDSALRCAQRWLLRK